MPNNPALTIAIVGGALATVFYWLSFLFGRITSEKAYFRWWCMIIVPQSMVVAAALKLLKLI